MISALLLIFVGYLLYKAFMFKRRIDAVRKDFRRQFEEAQRHFGGEQYGGEQNSASQPREKRYTQTDGEYVEFEELPDSTDPEPPHRTNQQHPQYQPHNFLPPRRPHLRRRIRRNPQLIHLPKTSQQVNEFVGCLTSRTGRTSLTVAGETGKNTD